MAPFKVIIVGGGLSGACLANGLLNHGGGLIDVAVYERDTVERERGGYQIRLGAHALTGFRACLTPQQYQQLLTCFGRSGGVVSSAPALYTVNMELLLDLGKFPVYTKSAPIARGRLRKFLQEPLCAAGVMHYGKQFMRYEILPDNKVRAQFRDGTSEDCDILVSAEGSGSRANKQLGLDNILDNAPSLGAGSLLGKCTLPQSVLRTLPKPLLEKGTMACGNNKALLFTAVYLPDSVKHSQNAANIKDVNVDDDGSGSGGDDDNNTYDEAEASLMVAIGWKEGPTSLEAAKLPDRKKYLREKILEAGFHPGYLTLVDALDPEAIQGVEWRFAKDTPVNWRERLLRKTNKVSATGSEHEQQEQQDDIANPRVWLMGDSIHPMLPSRGMGANNAIHDTADALGPLLELARRHKEQGGKAVGNEQVREQLRLYEKAMIPRAFYWVKTSNQQALPDMESLKGKCIILCLRVVLTVLSGVVGCARFLGWKPKDDAPELP